MLGEQRKGVGGDGDLMGKKASCRFKKGDHGSVVKVTFEQSL